VCGIAGLAHAGGSPVEQEALGRMAAAIRHRGPDGYGFLVDRGVGLAHCRLSIIDLAGGDQPLAGCGDRCWITYNGEIYNYLELRAELQARGHHFHSASDTEVVVHAIEEWDLAALDRFNGQFAFALFDRRDRSLLLVRDRFGVRPLFYARTSAGDIAFASEVKALFAAGAVEPAVDPVGLEQVFRFWAARPPRTVFRNVSQLEPGGWARWRDGRFDTGRWWQPTFPAAEPEPADAIARLDDLMRSSVALRMRADVPVGGYLSGGLDSSITCALAAGLTTHQLRTFSVTFADPLLDESAHQLQVARALNSAHAVQRIGETEIASVFPDVVRHAETPLLRTAPAPLYLLSRLARERGITVVLTGEGSDELFLGYTLFQEAALRRFCLRQPGSRLRPRLFDRLYPSMQQGGAGELWRRFFLDAGSPDDPLFSHLPRFRLASFIRGFYGPALIESLDGVDVESDLRAALPDDFARWSHPNQAAWLELTTLLDGYLLASQGDRMAMAHGVEGRFPFLDHRLFEFAAALPARSKLCGFEEKAILRRWSIGIVPEAVRSRPKQPYRAPDAPAFFAPDAPAYVEELLSDRAIHETGLFDPSAVAGLLRRCRAGNVTGTRENQAIVAVLSAQIWHNELIQWHHSPVPLNPVRASVRAGFGD
jgi:asparagine synthase (glutamine-hydrolysing)